tara:strand:- start:408 stop:875 length:468 start_codon:yes stop_codon:yes gene_type:complete
MNLTLVPICSEIDHDLNYDYNENTKCEICMKNYVSYRCINCDYGRCSKCHRDILAAEEIKERLRIAKIKNNIKIAEKNLKKDHLDDWDVMVVQGEICYINKLTRSYSYDYPLSKSPPVVSPIKERDNQHETINIKNDNHIRCTFTEIYNTIKSFF